MRSSAIVTRSAGASTVAVGGTVPLGTTVRRAGGNIVRAGDSVACRGVGYFDVTAKLVVTPEAAGTVTVSLLSDGVTIDTASATVAAADTATTLTLAGAVVNQCGCVSKSLSLVLSGAASSVASTVVSVVKVA